MYYGEEEGSNLVRTGSHVINILCALLDQVPTAVGFGAEPEIAPEVEWEQPRGIIIQIVLKHS
jgi:hypothetical protein